MATVVPWIARATPAEAPPGAPAPIAVSPRRTASAGSAGVERTFRRASIAPSGPSRTMSVKVPPVSMPITDMGGHLYQASRETSMTGLRPKFRRDVCAHRRPRGPALFPLAPLLLAGALVGAGCTGAKGGGAGARADGPPDHPLLAEAAERYLAGDRDGALARWRAYRAGFGPSPFCADAWYWEGVVLLETGDRAGAERAFRECLRAPRSRWFAAMAECGLGDSLFAADRFDEAVEAYRRALDQRCPDARTDYILYRMAVANERAGNWSRGRTCYELLLRDHPRSALSARARERLEHPHPAFFVQVGAFADEESARTLSLQILSKGLPARVVRGSGGEAPYLVWAGSFGRYDEARDALPEIARLCGAKSATLVP